MLSDAKRRQEYDVLYQTRADRSTDPNSSNGFFSQFSGMFGGGAAANGSMPSGGAQPNADGVFADVFDEVRSHSTQMLSPT